MKVRVRFSKLGKVRWISHRDVARCVERALRRTQIPVAYSEGFSPRPKVSFGLALPTGAESLAEYLDIDLAREVDVVALAPRLSAALPVGIDVTAVASIETGTDSLQESVALSRWEIGLWPEEDGQDRAAFTDQLAGRVADALAADTLFVTRERKGASVTDDIRPGMLSLLLDHRVDGAPVLVAELATRPRGIRPAELALALGLDAARLDVRRTHQWMERSGARYEPLSLVGPDGAPLAAPDGGRRRAG